MGAVNLNMAELTTAAVVRIEKELLNSRTRNNEEIINYLKDSDRPREDFQFAVLQLTCNNDPETLEKVLSWGQQTTLRKRIAASRTRAV